ncbi:MAG TPA: hypothetical protein VIK35_08780 [Verrucomicrobiae bacterium]
MTPPGQIERERTSPAGVGHCRDAESAIKLFSWLRGAYYGVFTPLARLVDEIKLVNEPLHKARRFIAGCDEISANVSGNCHGTEKAEEKATGQKHKK